MTGWPVTKKIDSETFSDDVGLALNAQKDPDAFAILYERYSLGVYRYVFSRVRYVESAEDLTSQIFLEALEHIGQYRPVGPFAAWLYTIARRRTADYFRKLRPTQPMEEEMLGDFSDPLSRLIQDEEIILLQTHLAALSETERELLRLRFAAGLSFADIGALLGKTPAAVKTATYRLLERLEDKMEDRNE